MSKNWLFLRGGWDEKTQKSIDDNDDVWIQLFNELILEGDKGSVLFKSDGIQKSIVYSNKTQIFADNTTKLSIYQMTNFDVLFVRGGFPWQKEIAKSFPKSYKIYYGAGRRYIPDENIYNLILCDSEKQKKEILQKYPKANAHLFIKPAAHHFKPIECKKEYDVCLIANETQGYFKGVQWVYDTVPKDLKVLHLGNFTGQYKAPENVTRKHVSRIDMPSEISKCKMGIIPYWNQIDSCPRIIPEMTACGLSLIVADELNVWNEKYKIGSSNKQDFWKEVKKDLVTINSLNIIGKNVVRDVVAKHYKENLSIPIAAKHIHNLIEKT